MDVEILSVVVGAAIGGVISAVSFHYKSRIEIRQKVNKALFHLLEIWSVIGITKIMSSELYAKKIVKELQVAFPKENIDEDSTVFLSKAMELALPVMIDAVSGGTDYLAKYTEAIQCLAPIYPVQAYELNKNQILIKYLAGIDLLFSKQRASEQDNNLLKIIKGYTHNTAFEDFEENLKELANQSSVMCGIKVRRHIKKIKNRVNNIPDELIREFIDETVKLWVQAHYDRQGLVNPNK